MGIRLHGMRLPEVRLNFRRKSADRLDEPCVGVLSLPLPPRGVRGKMTDLKSIRKFEYRPCRITTGFDIEFIVGDETFIGICRDVSDTGIRVKLEGSVVVGDSGLLTLRHPMGLFKIEAQVAYIDNAFVGLIFDFETQRERTATAEFMTALANHAAASLLVQYP